MKLFIFTWLIAVEGAGVALVCNVFWAGFVGFWRYFSFIVGGLTFLYGLIMMVRFFKGGTR